MRRAIRGAVPRFARLLGGLTGDGADVAAAEAEIGQFPVVERREFAEGLAIAAPGGEAGEDHGCDHGSISVRAESSVPDYQSRFG
jgi:hypothetical protein